MVSLGTHGEKYGNWMSGIVFKGLGGAAAAALILSFLLRAISSVASLFFLIIGIAAILLMLYMLWIRLQYGKGGVMFRIHQFILDNLGFSGKSSLLDVGCGSGAMTTGQLLNGLSARQQESITGEYPSITPRRYARRMPQRKVR